MPWFSEISFLAYYRFTSNSFVLEVGINKPRVYPYELKLQFGIVWTGEYIFYIPRTATATLTPW